MSVLLLHLETAAPVCSVCLSENNTVLAKAQSDEPNSHAKTLAVLIQKVFAESNKEIKNLHAVCVSEGPGSYTGLRIGFATAKGICYAAGLPLILISTLKAMALGIKKISENEQRVLLPVLDAHRNDVYFSFFNQELKDLITHDCKNVIEVNEMLASMNLKAVAAGTGTEKLSSFTENISVLNQSVIDAENMIEIALKKYAEKDFVDLAYSEPIYRK